MSDTFKTIGIIGLGIMGKSMAHNLLKAGFPVIVHNRHQDVTDTFTVLGAHSADLPKDVATACDVVITMLPNADAVERVLTGPNGVSEGAHEGLVVIDMGTISPIITRTLATRLRAQDIAMLDAPVSGGSEGAIAGTLSIMVGGDGAAFEQCLPIFRSLGTTITYVGDSGSGQVVKACNQIVVALILEAVSEALVLGSKAGVDPAKIVQVLSGGLAANKILELRGAAMVAHDFTPRGRARLHHKDLGIILELARTYSVSLPGTALVDQMFASLEAHGRGDLDHSALLTYIEDLSFHSINE